MNKNYYLNETLINLNKMLNLSQRWWKNISIIFYFCYSSYDYCKTFFRATLVYFIDTKANEINHAISWLSYILGFQFFFQFPLLTKGRNQFLLFCSVPRRPRYDLFGFRLSVDIPQTILLQLVGIHIIAGIFFDSVVYALWGFL